MSWGVVAVAGTSLVSNYMANEQNKSANRDAQKTLQDQSGLNKYMFDLTRSDLAPFRSNELQSSNIGLGFLNQLKDKINLGPGSFKESDSYKWTLGEGIKSLDKSAVAGGVSRNADTMKFAQGLASGEQDRFMDRWLKSLSPLQSMAKVPMTATPQTGSINQGFANLQGGTSSNMANLQMQQGQNNADFLSGIGTMPLNYLMMNQLMN